MIPDAAEVRTAGWVEADLSGSTINVWESRDPQVSGHPQKDSRDSQGVEKSNKGPAIRIGAVYGTLSQNGYGAYCLFSYG